MTFQRKFELSLVAAIVVAFLLLTIPAHAQSFPSFFGNDKAACYEAIKTGRFTSYEPLDLRNFSKRLPDGKTTKAAPVGRNACLHGGTAYGKGWYSEDAHSLVRWNINAQGQYTSIYAFHKCGNGVDDVVFLEEQAIALPPVPMPAPMPTLAQAPVIVNNYYEPPEPIQPPPVVINNYGSYGGGGGVQYAPQQQQGGGFNLGVALGLSQQQAYYDGQNYYYQPDYRQHHHHHHGEGDDGGRNSYGDGGHRGGGGGCRHNCGGGQPPVVVPVTNPCPPGGCYVGSAGHDGQARVGANVTRAPRVMSNAVRGFSGGRMQQSPNASRGFSGSGARYNGGGRGGRR